MSLAQVKSGHDLELILGNGFVKHLLQLLMDVGSIPTKVSVGDLELTLKAAPDSEINRTYGAFAGTEYAETGSEAFDFKTYDFGDYEPDYVYFSFRINIVLFDGKIDVYARIKKDVDIQDEIERILAYVDEEKDASGKKAEYDIHDLIAIVAALPEAQAYDAENPDNNASNYDDLVDEYNGYLEEFQEAITEAKYPDLLDTLRKQLEPLTIAALERIRFKAFPESSLGVYVNFKLLDHASGWVRDRGDLEDAANFLPDGADYALGTSEDLTRHLIDEILIKTVTQFQVDNDLMREEQALNLLNGDHYPLDVPGQMVTGKDVDEDDGDGTVRYQVRDTSVTTTSYSFKDGEGNKTRADSLKFTIVTSESLWKIIGLANENVVVFVTPLKGQRDGVTTADLGIDTNLRVNVLRTLVSALTPQISLKLLLLPFVAIINAFLNSSKELFEAVTASELGITILSRLDIIAKRWDPFYVTRHGVVLERDQLAFEDERLFLSGVVHLSKPLEPFPHVYVRDVCYQGSQVDRLLYKLESADDILTDSFFATDREAFEKETNDGESGIYSLPYASMTADGNARQRIDEGKLESYVPYNPYCTIQDAHEGHHHIDFIGMLSQEEVADLERTLQDEWVANEIEAIISSLEAMGFTFTDEMRESVSDLMDDYVRDSASYRDYVEYGLPSDLEEAIYARGKVRLRLSPASVDDLVKGEILELPGYQSVNRKGHLYYRDIADESVTDNLLTLPACDQ